MYQADPKDLQNSTITYINGLSEMNLLFQREIKKCLHTQKKLSRLSQPNLKSILRGLLS